MYQVRAKQIARLEKRARPFLEQRLGSAERWEKVRRGALNHAVVLGFLLRYGEPQIGEPLEEACRRVTESDAWKEYQAIIPPRWPPSVRTDSRRMIEGRSSKSARCCA